MAGRGRKGMPTLPRRHRMTRAVRLESARAWLASGGEADVTRYSKRYGVDRYTAYQEMVALGIKLRGSQARWAERPPPAPKRRPPPQTPGAHDCGWVVYGGQVIFPVGYTAAGFPYGASLEDLDEDERASVLAELGLSDEH